MKMSLFERLKNKRQDLTEVSDDFTSKQRKDNLNMLNKMFGSTERSKKTARDIKKRLNTSSKKENQRQKNQNPSSRPSDNTPKRGSTTIRTSRQLDLFTGKPEAPKEVPVKTKYKPRVKKNVVSSDPTIPGIDDESTSSKTTATKTKTVKQSEVSKKAKDFTKEINKKRTSKKVYRFVDPDNQPTGEVSKPTKPKNKTPLKRGFENVTGEGQVKYPKNRTHLIAKRKEYGIDRKGNISKTGVEKYARNMKRSNLPLTKKELSTAKQFAVGGKKIKDSTGKVVGTTTGKYGGRLGRRRNRNMKTYDQIKKEIDLKDLQKASDAKARKIARSQELKDLTKKMGEKELQQRVSQQATLKSIRPQRQFYKGAMKPARVITKAFAGPSGKVAPIVKTGLKVAAKAGPVGAIAAGTGLALLNPSIRKTAKKVAKAALGAAGIKAFMSKPKLAKRPPSKIGINLSPKA